MVRKSLAALPLTVLVSACNVTGHVKTWGGAFAEGAAEKGIVQLQGKPAEQAITKVTATSAAAAADAYKASLSPVVTSELSRFRAGAQDLLSAERESLAVAVSGPLSKAIDSAVHHNILKAGSALRDQETLFLQRVPDDYARYVAPVLAAAIVQSTDTALSRVAVALDTRLSKSTEALVSRAVAAGVTAGLNAAQHSGVWTTTVTIAVAGLIGLLLLALAWLGRNHVQARNALRAVARVIDNSGSDELKAAVKQSATREHVDKYLSGYFGPEAS